MTIAEEIQDLLIEATEDKPFTADAINEVLERRLYDVLAKADGILSAVRHGRKLEDSELEAAYYPLREVCDEISRKLPH